MKTRNVVIVFAFALCAVFQSTFAADTERPAAVFTYGLATSDDVEGLLDLVNTEAAQASDTLVVLPTLFREQALQTQVANGQLYIAEDTDGTVIGFKKLYLDKDPTETLENEIRCQGNGTERQYSGTYSSDLALSESDAYAPLSENAVVLYNGADFTHPDYRQQGVNRALMQAALDHVTAETVAHVRKTKADELVMVYGLVNAIAGAIPGDATDRTSSIVKCFAPFADEVQQQAYGAASPQSTSYDRFTAFKPSFAADSTKCKPLPDEHSVEGKGCVLHRILDRKETNE